MRKRFVVTVGLAALSLFTLAACAPGTGVPTAGDPDATESGGSGGIAPSGFAGCIEGAWQLDVDDVATQLQAMLEANGTPITTSVADGGVTLTVSGDEMIYDSDVTYTMSGDAEGLSMVIAQTHEGVSTGRWAEEGGNLVFSDWENAVRIINTVTIAGVAGEPTVVPGGIDNSVVMAATCEGDTLVTQPEGNPYISTWARAG